VGGNPPQTQKPRSQGAWPLNLTDVRRAMRCPGPGPPLRAQGGPWPLAYSSVFFHYFFWYFRFCIFFAFFFWCFLFCTCTCLKLCFFGGSLYFFVPTYNFKFLFKSVASSIFFCTSVFSNKVFFDFLFKIPFTMHNI
jgi:hypothetical protein